MRATTRLTRRPPPPCGSATAFKAEHGDSVRRGGSTGAPALCAVGRWVVPAKKDPVRATGPRFGGSGSEGETPGAAPGSAEAAWERGGRPGQQASAPTTGASICAITLRLQCHWHWLKVARSTARSTRISSADLGIARTGSIAGGSIMACRIRHPPSAKFASRDARSRSAALSAPQRRGVPRSRDDNRRDADPARERDRPVRRSRRSSHGRRPARCRGREPPSRAHAGAARRG